MKNLITIILCSLITINANSQKKWSFGIDLFPNYTMGSIFGGGSQFNGIGYNIFKNNHINPYVQPTIEFSFLEISKNSPLNRNSLSLGIVIGAKF
jgi:hypothetical protein